MTIGKSIALAIQTFVSKVITLSFNTLFRFVIAFLPRSKPVLFSWLQWPSTVVLEPKKIKSVSFHFSPFICHKLMGPGTMILVFWMLNFETAFQSPLSPSSRDSLAPLHFCHYSVIFYICEVVNISPDNLDSSLCLIQPSISHDVLCIEVKEAEWQYTALLYSFCNFEMVSYSMSSSNCCFLTCIQISQEAGQVVWYSHLFQNFPVCCDPHSQRL